jgi:hypothetical protein
MFRVAMAAMIPGHNPPSSVCNPWGKPVKGASEIKSAVHKGEDRI